VDKRDKIDKVDKIDKIDKVNKTCGQNRQSRQNRQLWTKKVDHGIPCSASVLLPKVVNKQT
jgi:hypothetical protein